jgi:cysteine desulfurase/selenocysteine lyase
VPVTDEGEFRLDEFAAVLNERTKLVAIAHISNVLGTVVPLKDVVRMAHEAGAKVLVDGAQAVMHTAVDVRDLDCDFYAFSGHKLYGPSGIGALYGKAALLDAMPPYMGGGMMISSVSFENSEWAALPHKFEAGTPAIAEAAGLGAAIDYVTGLGLDAIAAHEQDVLGYATQRLSSIDGLKIIGTAAGKASVLSFTMDCAHPHDIGTLVDRAGVAIRVGHHCAQPLMDRMGVPATGRASFGIYNTRAEVDVLTAALEGVKEFFG